MYDVSIQEVLDHISQVSLDFRQERIEFGRIALADAWGWWQLNVVFHSMTLQWEGTYERAILDEASELKGWRERKPLSEHEIELRWSF